LIILKRVIYSVLIVAMLVPCSTLSSRLETSDFWDEFMQGYSQTFKGYAPEKDVAVEMAGPRKIVCGGYGEWTFTFTAGSRGMDTGEAIALAFRHSEGWGIPQDFDPGGINYVSAETTADVNLRLEAINHLVAPSLVAHPYFLEYFPWQHMTTITIERGRLQPGQRVQLIFGDRSEGSPGFRAPSIARPNAPFLAFVRKTPTGQFTPIPTRLTVSTQPTSAVHFNIVVPSNTVANEPFRVILRAEDAQGNAAGGYRGEVDLLTYGGQTNLPESYTFQAEDQGVHRFEGVRFFAPGIYRITAKTTDGLSGTSNPSKCSSSATPLQTFWGDLHGHTVMSDGAGSPSEVFRYARDVAGLDYFAVTDHSFLMDEIRWLLESELATEFNDPPEFVTFYGTEWSGETKVGGDHNVIYERPGLPIFRSKSYYAAKNPFTYSEGSQYAENVARLFELLGDKAAELGTRVLVFPSIRGRIANADSWNGGDLSPVVEVVSEAGWYEDLALEFLKRGHRLGFIGNSDDHDGRPGYGRADLPQIGYRFPRQVSGYKRRRHYKQYPWGQAILGSPLSAVFAKNNRRKDILDAIFARHCYATTGARIMLEFRMDGHDMGEEFIATGPPEIEIRVVAQAPIASIDIKKDGQVLISKSFGENVQEANVTHVVSDDYTGRFFYVVVNQVDGQRAISSPIWID
jgi:hypothetical protein